MRLSRLTGLRGVALTVVPRAGRLGVETKRAGHGREQAGGQVVLVVVVLLLLLLLLLEEKLLLVLLLLLLGYLVRHHGPWLPAAVPHRIPAMLL